MTTPSVPRASVSVVVPFFRDAASLARALASIQNQTLNEPVEVIVVDDGSSESLDHMLEAFPHVRLVSQENSGPGPARNRGIDIARGEFIAFLDSDDYWHQDKLRTQLQLMRSTGAAWSQHSFWVVDSAGTTRKFQDTSHLSGDVRRRVLTSFRIQTSAVMVRRSALLDNDIRFSDDRVGEDGYLYARLAQEFPLLAIAAGLSFFTWHGDNAGGKAAVQLWSRARLWQRYESLVRENASPWVLVSYRWCASVTRLLAYTSVPPRGTRSQEAIAKLLYLPAYVVLRVAAGRSRP